jgi:hypothetical protein
LLLIERKAVEPLASWTTLSAGAQVNASIPQTWSLSQGFMSCSHAKQFFLSNNLSRQLKDAIYPIAMRPASNGGGSAGSVVLPFYCSNMSAATFYAPKEHLLLPENAAVSSTLLPMTVRQNGVFPSTGSSRRCFA